MTVNFDLPLRAGMRAFARPVTVTPEASRPGDPLAIPPVPKGQPYAGRGIWTSRPVDVPTDGPDGIVSSQNHTLLVRALDYPIPPAAGDYLDIPAFMSLPAVGRCRIEDVDEDGYGGLTLSLKALDGDEDDEA